MESRARMATSENEKMVRICCLSYLLEVVRMRELSSSTRCCLSITWLTCIWYTRTLELFTISVLRTFSFSNASRFRILLARSTTALPPVG